MIATKITTSAQTSDIIHDIMVLVNDAETALAEGDQAKFVDITHNIETCAAHTYSELASELKAYIFDICWDINKIEALEIGGIETNKLIQAKACDWNKSVIDTCNRYMV